uniref:Putative methyl-CpG-binding domain-containing protein 13 isoform X1 n=1 Tax=Davidia involucrata TaxID=16924 RepID=A0A5B7AM95_DAVIN
MVAGQSPDWLPAGWTVQVKVKNGRKVKYYFNGETGQKFDSKNDIIRYVKMGKVRVRQSINKHNKRRSEKKSMPLAAKTNEFENSQPVNKHNKRRSEKKPMPLAAKTNEFENKRRSEKKPMPLTAKTNERPEWLPHGWIMEVKSRKTGSRIGMKYKCYIDPVTGYKFYSKPEVSQYLKTVKRNSRTSEQKKIGVGSVSNCYNDQLTGGKSSLKPELSQNLKTVKGKSSTSKEKKVVVERVTPDGLPPGWIKEIRIQKKVTGTRKDPFYTDPESGYIFRSKKDALRYLETGDINSCATKPKKRGINDVESMNEEISPQSVGKGHKLEHHTSRRRLFAGKESCDTSSLVASDAEGSKEGQRKAVSADVTGTSTPTDEILEGKHLLDNVVEKCAETKEGPDPSSSILPKTKGSKRKRGKNVLAENGPVSSPATNILQEEKLLENGTEKLSNRTTQIDPSKCKNEKVFSFPHRSSKRLAGLKPELVANSGLSERAVRAATRKSGESEANPSLGLALDDVADSVPQQLDAEPETEIAHHASGGIEAPSDVEPSNKGENPLGVQALPESQPGRQETEKKDENPESQLFSPFGDSWSDPCLEFAFKTLTGAIPVEDNLSIQGYFQQEVDASQTLRDGCSALPDFGLNSVFQNDVPSHFDALEKPAYMQQLTVNPTFLPPGNVSLPSRSGNGPQQPNLDLNKEYQAKVD